MKGDYTRYLAKISTGDDRTCKSQTISSIIPLFYLVIAERSRQAYQNAVDLAKKKLIPTHRMWLSLVNNFSVLYLEILDSQEKAYQLVKEVILYD